MTALPNHRDRSSAHLDHLDHLDGLLDQLEPSNDPAVVFTSLVSACVPAFSDECSVEILADGGVAHRLVLLDLPARDRRPDSRGRLGVAFDGAAHGAESYRGTLECTWHQRDDTVLDAVVTRILVGRAEAATANLRIALASSRTIGNAVGILMVAYKINDAAAFELLRSVSRRSNRKVVDMATDVVETGCLDHT